MMTLLTAALLTCYLIPAAYRMSQPGDLAQRRRIHAALRTRHVIPPGSYKSQIKMCFVCVHIINLLNFQKLLPALLPLTIPRNAFHLPWLSCVGSGVLHTCAASTVLRFACELR